LKVARILYRTAAIILLLLTAGHTFGFRTPDPNWGADSLIRSMQSLHFDALGSNRTYWDFFVGFGLVVSVFFVFAAILSWQFAGLAAKTLAQMRGPVWTLAIAFGVVTILNLRYFFILPVVCSALVFVCLTAAAWLSAKDPAN
jgi:hypothetical protein